MRNAREKFIFCVIFIPVNLMFIWGNSLLPGEVSGQISNRVLLFVKDLLTTLAYYTGRVLGSFGYQANLDWLGGYLIRKLGHFTEFACLGFTTAELFLILGERGIHRLTTPLLTGLLVACADETIQKFVAGRGSSVVDVWIDTGGLLVGIGALFALRSLILLYYKEKQP